MLLLLTRSEAYIQSCALVLRLNAASRHGNSPICERPLHYIQPSNIDILLYVYTQSVEHSIVVNEISDTVHLAVCFLTLSAAGLRLDLHGCGHNTTPLPLTPVPQRKDLTHPRIRRTSTP